MPWSRRRAPASARTWRIGRRRARTSRGSPAACIVSMCRASRIREISLPTRPPCMHNPNQSPRLCLSKGSRCCELCGFLGCCAAGRCICGRLRLQDARGQRFERLLRDQERSLALGQADCVHQFCEPNMPEYPPRGTRYRTPSLST